MRNVEIVFSGIKGLSNLWYGNELICEGWDIGVYGSESCFSKEEINDDEIIIWKNKLKLNI